MTTYALETVNCSRSNEVIANAKISVEIAAVNVSNVLADFTENIRPELLLRFD